MEPQHVLLRVPQVLEGFLDVLFVKASGWVRAIVLAIIVNVHAFSLYVVETQYRDDNVNGYQSESKLLSNFLNFFFYYFARPYIDSVREAEDL